MPTITFGPQVCGDLSAGAQREWLVTDGLGGYAMGTVSGLRTRRYHGLLTVAESPSRRFLALASLDPTLVLDSGARIPLGVHEWADGTIAPSGHLHLERFDLIDGVPRWQWRLGDTVLSQEVAMTHRQPGVSVAFQLLAGPGCDLELRPLVTWRDSHQERHASADLVVALDARGVVVEGRYRVDGPGWQPDGQWYRGARMREEAARGLAATEDLWSAGTFHARLHQPGDAVEVRAWPVDGTEPAPHAAVAARGRARSLLQMARASGAVEEHLVLAADAFIIDPPDVVAGYPWFGTWSRDTMISFEGLFLETGRHDEGRRLLTDYGARLNEGMLANTADTGTLEYNTVDATLWFAHAIDRHVTRTGDDDLAAAAAPWLRQVIEAHLAGTRYGIRADVDGLLTQGQDHMALTWMDARLGDFAVTPRIGKPVEVNALWINALAVAGMLHQRLDLRHEDIDRAEARARSAFALRFHPAGDGSVADVVDGPGGEDPSVRPNQIIAASLPHGPAVDPRWLGPTGALLTPLGLRTLHPWDPRYREEHTGDVRARDEAYHQGTTWPWLIGPLASAAHKLVLDPGPILDGLAAHLGEWGLGSVSETANGDPPHTASGTPFQAWSVAEALRAHRLLADRPMPSRSTDPTAGA